MDQLELIDCVSSAGIDSLRGFSYQIKVFLLYLSKIKDNERMGYETIDDVSIQKLNESNFDEKCKQLQYCGLSEPSMKINLGYRQYYQQYRLMNLENGRVDAMNSIEMTSFENFIQTKDRVQAENIDTPRNRFEETKRCSNSYASTEQIRYGTLIYLTGESIDDDIKISWKDDENDADKC